VDLRGWLTITGKLDNDIIQPALGGGLVLIVLLIGFTVMQHAFAGGAFQQGLFSDLERQSLALTGSGDMVWDWDVARDRVVTIPDVSVKLGLSPGTMHGAARNWLPRLHPDDRDRFRATLDVLLEHRRGRLNHEFRIRAEDGHFHWLLIRARPVLGSNGEVIRCVGTIVDVTEQKNSIDRLLQDALHDNLTGLPNRQLFLDRLQGVLALAPGGDTLRPTVMVIDIDRYKLVNDALGVAAGDNILIALTRRLRRLLKPQDTLARLSGDQFGLILDVRARSGEDRRFCRCDQQGDHGADQLRQPRDHPDGLDRACLLRRPAGKRHGHAQRRGACHVPRQTRRRQPRRAVPAGLPRFRRRPAAARIRSAPRAGAQGTVDGLPADRRLEDVEIAGFEALMRWEHPKRGNIPPSEFIPIAEASDIINMLGIFALEQATNDLMGWENQTGELPIFVSINLSSAQLLNNDLYDDVRSVLAKTHCDPAR
jgi:PAS domain S-box-containing protein